MQDPVQDGVASPATPGTGKSKVTRIQYLTSGLTEEWKGDEWGTLAWGGGVTYLKEILLQGISILINSVTNMFFFFFGSFLL